MYEFVGADHWRRTTLYQLARWKNGLAFKNINFAPAGRPVIKIAELKSGITDQTKFTDGEYDPDVLVANGDMLFSWSGNPDTSIDVFRWRGPTAWLNQHIYKVYPSSDVHEEFLFFLLRALRPRFAEIARNKQTTGLGHVTLGDFKQMAVGLPSSAEQREIVSVVGPLHDKIELNRRVNETLEAQARALFRDWFVDFGPVKAKMAGAAPYLTPDFWSLFPDRLDDNGAPKGWPIRQVRDALNLAYGKSLPARDRKLGDVPVYGSGGATGTHDVALIDGPAVIVGRKGTVGSIYWEHRPSFPIDTVFYVEPKLPLAFCFHLLSSFPLGEMNTDAAVPGLNRENVYRLEFPMPPDKLVSEFATIATGLRNKINANDAESRTLAQTRDLLLPKLISGEICLGEAERELEEAR